MRIELKLSIVRAGLKNQDLANLANESLSKNERLTEHAITRLITERSRPTASQAEAIAHVLKRKVAELFDSGEVLA